MIEVEGESRAVAPKGLITYAFPQGNFLLLLLLPPPSPNLHGVFDAHGGNDARIGPKILIP